LDVRSYGNSMMGVVSACVTCFVVVPNPA
jgi:hypothetical protein